MRPGTAAGLSVHTLDIYTGETLLFLARWFGELSTSTSDSFRRGGGPFYIEHLSAASLKTLWPC